jgi:hypothetical protein
VMNGDLEPFIQSYLRQQNQLIWVNKFCTGLPRMNRTLRDSSLVLQPIEALGSTRNFLKAALSNAFRKSLGFQVSARCTSLVTLLVIWLKDSDDHESDPSEAFIFPRQ